MLAEIRGAVLAGLLRVHVIDHMRVTRDKMHLVALQDVKQPVGVGCHDFVVITGFRTENLGMGREDQRRGLVHIPQVTCKPLKQTSRQIP